MVMLFFSVEKGQSFAKSAPYRHLHKMIQFIELEPFHHQVLEQMLIDRSLIYML